MAKTAFGRGQFVTSGGDRALPEREQLALTGEVAGVAVFFALAGGANRIGSESTNHLVLEVDGVSRHHAMVIVEEDRAQMLDHGSKNGTFVNGERIRSATVAAGDEIWLGPVELRLESVGADDVVLAIELDTAASTAPKVAAPDTTAEVWHPGRSRAETWTEAVRLFVERATQAPSFGAARRLQELLAGAGIAGAVVVEMAPDEEPVLLEQVGEIETMQTRRIWHLWQKRRERELFLLEPDVVCLLRRLEDRALGILVAGRFQGRSESRPLLLALLTIYEQSRRPWTIEAGNRPAIPGPLVFPPGHVRGSAATTEQLYTEIEQLSVSDLPVLICGETGVGKELVARTLHLSSHRREAPFVAINCAAIPAELLEAELFGIGRGVATGVAQRSGLFKKAVGGTIFLDEVGEMPAALQAKLLRVLQEKEIRPVGGTSKAIDVRVLAATNAEIYAHMDAGRFRRDLFYRLAGSVLRVPALRQRRADIPLLAEKFLRAIAGTAGKSLRGMTVAAQKALTRYDWPGNVRELEHEMRRLVYACPAGQAISARLLVEHIREVASNPMIEPATVSRDVDRDSAPTLPTLVLSELEKLAIESALRRGGGKRASAAELLGISRFALLRRLKRQEL